jgi:hypothetical protein
VVHRAPAAAAPRPGPYSAAPRSSDSQLPRAGSALPAAGPAA